MGKFLDINAAGGNIRRDQDSGGSTFKISECVLACVLGFVSMNGLGGQAGFFERPDDFVRTVFGSRKDQGRVGVDVLQKVSQQIYFIPSVDPEYFLPNGIHRRCGRRNLNEKGIRQDGSRECFNLGRHRRREKHRLSLGGKTGNNAPNVMNHAHVEHTIRFIQYKKFDVMEPDMALIHQIQKATRGRDEDINAGLEASHLRILRYAAENDQRA